MEDEREGMGDGGKWRTMRYGQWWKVKDNEEEKRGWRRMRRIGQMVGSGG